LAKILSLAIALSVACSSPQTQEKTRGSNPPTADFDPDISLNVSVGVVSGRVLFDNKSGEELHNILVVMTDEPGNTEFRHTIGTVPAFAFMHFVPRVFTTSSGIELDPAVHRIKTIAVYGDTPSGRGRWHGSY
jgi:hypothetical protein